jgi:hypothetical protein
MASLTVTFEAPEKLIAAPKKFYTSDDQKFRISRYKLLNFNLRNFYEACNAVKITLANYYFIYSNMLAKNALNFYNSHLTYRNLFFDQMVEKTRAYFHTSKIYQMHVNEWQKMVLKDVIASNPQKNVAQYLDIIIEKLQKFHDVLLHNYGSVYSLPGQLVTACQGVQACDSAIREPATKFENLASELRSAVGIWQRSHI